MAATWFARAGPGFYLPVLLEGRRGWREAGGRIVKSGMAPSDEVVRVNARRNMPVTKARGSRARCAIPRAQRRGWRRSLGLRSVSRKRQSGADVRREMAGSGRCVRGRRAMGGLRPLKVFSRQRKISRRAAALIYRWLREPVDELPMAAASAVVVRA